MKIFLAVFSIFLFVSSATAGPIYVYRERGGIVRFSTKPPANGGKAEVFTSRGRGTFSSVSGRAWFAYSSSSYFGGKLKGELYKDAIQRVSDLYGVEPSLVRAIIHVESSFNPGAVSPKGAQGLMQLMPSTGRMHGLKRPFEPEQNIEAGTRHIAQLLKKYEGNQALALAAYNAGEGAVEMFGGIPPYGETQEYVRRVQLMKDRYRAIG